MDRRAFTLLTLFSALLGSAQGNSAAAQGDFGGLHRRLKLTEEQRKKIHQLYEESDRRKSEIEERLNKLYAELDRLYDQYAFDPKRVRAVTREISDVRQSSLTHYLETEQKLRHIITREQFDKLRNITRVRKGERVEEDK